jgi:hypothetical protein
MQDWLSYRLSDLLLFSEQSYLRQFELYNEWLSPLQWLFYLYGILLIIALFRRQDKNLRILFMISAALWMLCSYGYLWQFYVAINWMAEYFIVLFVIQAILIIWLSLSTASSLNTDSGNLKFISAVLLWIITLIAQPVTEYLSGRGLSQLSVFAGTPDSLCYISIAFMLVLRLPSIYFIPVAVWLLFSSLTYVAMDDWMGIFPAFALMVYIGFIFYMSPSLKKDAQKKSTNQSELD